MSLEKQVEWLREDIAKIDEKLSGELKDVRKELHDISKFKWKVLGGTSTVHFFVAILIQVGIALLYKG